MIAAPRAGRDRPARHVNMVMLGGLCVLVVAAALFARFGIDEELRRDEAVFAYAGQQLAEGVAPYVSIIDAKTPLAAFLAGGAVAAGRPLGFDDLVAIRIAFFVLSCLTVVAIYFTGMLLFRSVAAGAAAAIAFVTFKGYAIDALGGPNAKTPGVLFAVLTTALMVRGHWFLAGICAGLALLVWQPLAVYAILAVVAAFIASGARDRWRNASLAATGAAIPGIAIVTYFALSGALGELVEGAVLIPTVGRPPSEGGLAERIVHIVGTVAAGYGLGGGVVWIGLGVLVLLVVVRVRRLRTRPDAARPDPLVLMVAPAFGSLLALSLVDFQGYPDAFPLLPYAAFGIGGGVAAVLARGCRPGARRALVTGAAFALGAMAVLATWAWYSEPRPEATALRRQRADAAAAEALLRPGDSLRVLGSPAPLVLTGRRNPSRAIYLSAGIDRWVIEHTPGGFEGWTAEIMADGTDMVVVGGWTGEYLRPMREWLRANYEVLRIGELETYTTPAVRDRASS